MSKLTDTAPQRIFLQVSDEEGDEDCVFSDLQRDGAEVTWCDASMVCCEVKYVRADLDAALRAEVAQLRAVVAAADKWQRESVGPKGLSDKESKLIRAIGEYAAWQQITARAALKEGR